MSASTLQDKAAKLLSLHHGGKILILPNAWDAGSARIIAGAGFPVIATTSAGVAYSKGMPDGERITRGEMLEAVARIASAVSVPVTADMEAGYGDIAATVRGVLEAGAVGFNLEDREGSASELVPLDEQVERIRVARTTGDAEGVHVVINARTDVFLAAVGPVETRMGRTIERAKAYAAAGADCLFIPAVTDETAIAELVRALAHPINILATARCPPVARLQELGVARLSLGSGAARAAMGAALDVAEELRDEGTYDRMLNSRLSYLKAQRLFGE